MKFYIPFGDWSGDGDGQYRELLVEAPSMEYLLEAQKQIKEKYGKDFFQDFANDYGESNISDVVYKALLDTGFDFNSLWDEETILSEPGCCTENLELKTVQTYFVHLLNAFGAEITVLENYPQINNWTCKGFETVGYGCFYC